MRKAPDKVWLVYLIEDRTREWSRFVGRVSAPDKRQAARVALKDLDIDAGDERKIYVGGTKPYAHAPDPLPAPRP